MKETIIQEVREKYYRAKKEKETLLSYKEELSTLLEDKNVQRFMELSKLVNCSYQGPSEETLITQSYQEVPEAFGKQNTDSNHVMVFMGSYLKNSSNPGRCSDEITYEQDPNTSYKIYMDLETEDCYTIKKDECLAFERKYLTLYLPICEYDTIEYRKKYRALQKWFMTQLIHRPQAEVVKEINEKIERKYKALYPYFYQIDTIANLPIERYIEEYPADGFIETFCLAPEEYKRVKLYRKQLAKKHM